LTSDDNLRSICKGAVTNKDMGKTMNFAGNVTLNPDAIASPCGFLAKNFPLDDYKSLTNDKGEVIPVSTQNLIMKEEKEKFQQDLDVPQWVDVSSDRFINWMVGLGNSRNRRRQATSTSSGAGSTKACPQAPTL
jgi:hypothetical protein